MANNMSIEDLQRSTVIDQDGDKVGKVGQVYLDDATGQPRDLPAEEGHRHEPDDEQADDREDRRKRRPGGQEAGQPA